MESRSLLITTTSFELLLIILLDAELVDTGYFAPLKVTAFL